MDQVEQILRLTFRMPVHFTTGVFATGNPVLRSVISGTDDPAPADAIAVVDSGVAAAHPTIVDDIARYAAHHGDALRLAGPVLVLPGGEQAKNDARHLAAVYEAIQTAGLCRHSYVLAVGGGAVLDVVGYAAATAHRGIRQIRVPTTVLSQDDSAMGVKNGVNGFGKKNYFGTFAPPFAVINDSSFLLTLEDRDWLGGVAEAVKAALIKDAAFFDDLERMAPALVARDAAVMNTMVRRSAILHLDHIANGGDPFEFGSSRPLDFGHWSAHRLEHLTDHRLRHGEAVAIGVALDSTYSYISGRLPEPDWRRILSLLQALRLPIYTPELSAELDTPDHPRSVLRGLAEFREHLGGQLTVILLDGIGRRVDVHDIRTEGMIRSIDMLREIAAGLPSSRATPGLAGAASARGRS
jgi:3-dehydroquinate synthase